MGPKKDAAPNVINTRLAAASETLDKHEERIQNLEKRMKDNEEAVKAIGKNLQRVEESLTDLKRQNAKTCIILSGQDIPNRVNGENPITIFINQVKRKYNIRISEDELATVHRLGNGSLIAKFTKYHSGSGYYRLAVRRGQGAMNPNANIRVYANLKLTAFDAKIRFYAAVAKRVGTILFYEQQLSGHIAIVVPISDSDRTKKITIKSPADLKPYLTEEVFKEIEDMNKKRKARKSKKKDQLHDQQVDELLRSDDEHRAGNGAGDDMDVQD